MLSIAVVGLKPSERHDELIALARSVVADGGTLHLASFVKVGVDEDELARARGAEQELEAAQGPLLEAGYVVHSHTHVTTSPGSELLQLAAAENAEVIVIGLGNRSRVGKALLGSDAQTVLLDASVPVLCARFE